LSNSSAATTTTASFLQTTFCGPCVRASRKILANCNFASLNCHSFFLILLNAQILPFSVNQRLGFLVHQYLIGPGTAEALRRPFSRGVDAHLRSEIRQPRRVIERIH